MNIIVVSFELALIVLTSCILVACICLHFNDGEPGECHNRRQAQAREYI